ncbi:hypothetical protein AB6A40_000261 [Gnathostoma spinigerum]|uniref:Uncharacterized protein n=1 Tax=Gnathostoma spinigerum TaxID=75299 RepID=A0ABD6EAQ0_9BILA
MNAKIPANGLSAKKDNEVIHKTSFKNVGFKRYKHTDSSWKRSVSDMKEINQYSKTAQVGQPSIQLKSRNIDVPTWLLLPDAYFAAYIRINGKRMVPAS